MRIGSVDSMVSTAARLRVRLPGVQIPAEARDLSLFQNIQTSPGAHPASYSMGTGGFFSWGKVAEE